MAKYIVNIILVTACLFTYTSCIRKMNLYDENRNTGQDNNEKDTDSTPVYMYPFDKETANVTAEIIIHTPLHQGVIFQGQISVGEASRNVHLFLVFKGQNLSIRMTVVFSGSQIHSHIKYAPVQTRYQLCLHVFTLLEV